MKIAKIQLYGEIDSYGENSAGEFGKRLAKAEKEAEEIHLHIHSPGGNCFEGNLIYNLIKQSSKPVDIYIDGMAASMASIIMMAGRKIFIAKNAFIMIHSPWSCMGGNADEFEKAAKLLRNLEDIFLDVYSQRTGKDKEYVGKWLNGDNWFNATEAKAENMIDGIVEASDIKMLSTFTEMKKMSASAAFQQCSASINNKKQKQTMDKEKLIAKFGLTGVTASSSDEEIQAAIQAKLDAANAAVEKSNKERTASLINAAIVSKKIAEAQRQLYEGVAEKSGNDVLEQMFASMNVPTSITSALGSGKQTPAGREAWGWNEWQEKDPRGLEAMQTNDPEAFKALYDAEYK